MAGQPVKRRIIAELERRAKAASTPEAALTALDIIHDYIAAGATMRDLTRDLAKVLGENVSDGVLTTWVHSTPGGRAMLAQARALAAHAMAEESLEIVDDADEEKSALNKAKLRADQRMRLAAAWNRKDYGQDQQAISVTINNGQEHLEALRHRQVQNATPKMLPPAEADFEIVSDEPVNGMGVVRPASTGEG